MKISAAKHDPFTGFDEVTVQSTLRLTHGTFITTTTSFRLPAVSLDIEGYVTQNKDASLLCLAFKVATHTHRNCLLCEMDNRLIVVPNFNELLQKLYAPQVALDEEYASVDRISGRIISGLARTRHNEFVPFRVDFRNGTIVRA